MTDKHNFIVSADKPFSVSVAESGILIIETKKKKKVEFQVSFMPFRIVADANLKELIELRKMKNKMKYYVTEPGEGDGGIEDSMLRFKSLDLDDD